MTTKAKDNILIGDLVEVPEIRTVIQLQDLKDAGLRRMITDTFVVTGEVSENLKAVFSSICSSQGRGIFLKGHFGSGKSHFLSMLALLLKHSRAWKTVVAQEPSLGEFAAKRRGLQFLIVDVSLVEHRASEFLEDILLRAIFKQLVELVGREVEGGQSRQETFLQIKEILIRSGFSGMVLLIDELSEFLRSKADARAYNEDIRFLQYLGELAPAFPLWIVASLQEWIEETGEIHQDTFNKIKDRYRIRLNLGRAHIEELVSERLIRHRAGADEKIAGIFYDVKSYFPAFPVSLERFSRLYPVHPATSTLLDRLKPLFSEHRGVVDFIHYRLKGDPERHIPSLLDHPAHELLTPEVIFDHFLDRIRERSESQIYVERVFESYRDDPAGIFADPDQQKVALSAVKLLILFAISPVKIKYTVQHMAEMVLFRVTPMEAKINYEFFRDILDRLAREGSYVRVEEADDPLKSCYFIDLKTDIAGIMRRRVRHMASGLFSEDRRLFWKPASMADSAHLPLAGWAEQGKQRLLARWEHTTRKGVLFLRQLDEVSKSEIEGLGAQWARSEDDFFLFVGTTHACDSQFRHVRQELLPTIRDRYCGIFLFWIPAAPEKPAWLKEVLAAQIMLEQMKADRSQTNKREIEYLEMFLQKERGRVCESFTRAYFHGILLWDQGQVELSPYGYLTQDKFLSEFIRPLFRHRFPRHNRVHPYMDALAPGILQTMLRDFFSTGVLRVDDRSKFAVRNLLEGFFKPMGLMKKKGNQYVLHVDARRNELVQEFFNKMGEKETVPLDDLYWRFRKGPYGLTMPQFEILVMALLFSGHLIAYKGMKRKGLDNIAQSGIKGITALGKGEILREELREAITNDPLIPERFRKIPLTLASQEQLWSEIKAVKPRVIEDLEGLLSRIKWARSFQAFKNMPWHRAEKDIGDIIFQWKEVRVSMGSRDGLEHFLSARQREPFLEKKLEVVGETKGVLEQAERALFVYQYITDARLKIPEVPAWESLRRQRDEMLEFFRHKAATISAGALEEVFGKFRAFQEEYIRTYTEAHHRSLSNEQFEPYEKLAQSRRYGLLRRLDRLEMISVRHNRRSVDQALSTILHQRCDRSPPDLLQGQPVCSCGFQLGQKVSLKPLRELEKEIDMGIMETVKMLQSPGMQEKIIPYVEGLDLVGKKDEAASIRRLLKLKVAEDQEFFDTLDQALTQPVIHGINEAFRGKVVVIQRDLDRLYESLIHRKYTLSQTRRLIDEWLRGEKISDDTFLHFVGGAVEGAEGDTGRELTTFLREEFSCLMPLFREIGYRPFVRAMLASGWARQWEIEPSRILRALPFLKRGKEAESPRLISDFAEMTNHLRSENCRLFEMLVSTVEEDSSFVQSLWSLLSPRSPREIFAGERIFPAIVKEGFERLLGTDQVKVHPVGSSGLPDHGLEPAPTVLEQRKRMTEALEEYELLRQKRSSLKRPPSEDAAAFRRWESVFLRAMSPIPSLCDDLYAKLERIGTPVQPFLRKEINGALAEVDGMAEDFSAFYRKAIPLWEQGKAPRPTMIEDVPFLITRKRKVPDHLRVQYLLMDGMRWDLWEVIKKDFFGKMADRFRVLREGVLWAHQPSDTATQLACLEEPFREAYPNMAQEELLWKVSGIDERIHTEKSPLPFLFANVIRYLELELAFRLRELPPRTLLILFSDHGFVENRAFSPRDKYDASRYMHGKDSPFEVIVPWAWVMRI